MRNRRKYENELRFESLESRHLLTIWHWDGPSPSNVDDLGVWINAQDLGVIPPPHNQTEPLANDILIFDKDTAGVIQSVGFLTREPGTVYSNLGTIFTDGITEVDISDLEHLTK